MAKLIIPDEATPRLFGRLTLLIGGVLLALGAWMSISYLIAPLFEPMGRWTEASMGRVLDEALLRRLDRLTQDLADAKTPAETSDLNQRISLLLSQPRPNVNTMSGGMQSPVIRGFGIADTAVGFLLNVVMVIGAAGLVGLREWGRKTVVIVSALKLAKLALSSVLMIAWVLPIQMRMMREQLDPMFKNQPGAPPGSAMTAELVAAMTMGGTIVWALMASIYPILLLVMLTKTRVRAACRSASLPDRDMLA